MAGQSSQALCQCGCGQPAPLATRNDKRFNWVKGKPKRYISGHNRRFSPVEYVEDPGTGCWLWRKYKNNKGYGMIYRKGQSDVLAHRAYYERFKGPIPEGLEIDHLCRNPGCVNPDHLEPVTHAENLRRGKNAKFTWELVEEARAEHRRTGISARQLAFRYGVSHTAMSDVISGRRWTR